MNKIVMTFVFLALSITSANAAKCLLVGDKHSDARYKVETNKHHEVFVSLVRHSDQTEAAGIELENLYVGNNTPMGPYQICAGFPYGPGGCYLQYSYPSEFSGKDGDSKIRIVGVIGSRMVIYHKFTQADGGKHTHIAGEVSYCFLDL